MAKVFSAIAFTLLYLGFFALTYSSVFFVMLSDDIEFNRSRRTLKRKRKKEKGFWKKFLFLDLKQYTDKWHYFLFVCFLILSPIVLFCIDAFIITENEIFRTLFMISGGILFVITSIASTVRWSLYKGNMIRKRPTKRRP